MLPDVVVNVLDATVSRTVPTDTAMAYFVGASERGPIDGPRQIASLSDFTTKYGARQTSSALYDAVETYFAEGGSRMTIQRVIGTGAVAASRTLLDGSAAVALTVTAGQLGSPDPGVWGNSLSVAVVAGAGAGQFVLVVTRSGVEVERSPSLDDTAAAVAWARTNSKYLVVTQGVSTNDPAVAAAAALSAGADGAALADANWQTALDAIPRDLGPGQIAAPGRTTAAGQLQLLAHAQNRNRFALLDAPDTASDTTLVAAAQALYTAPNKGRRYGQLLAPWDVVPGLTALTTRTVPPSARAAAQYARVDALGNPNQAAAGRYGIARFAIDLSQAAWTDTQRQSLSEAGVTVSRRRFGSVIQTYDAVTLADQANDAGWVSAPNVRTIMAYVAEATLVGDSHQFDQVDGNGRALGAFRGDLIGAANDLYNVGALYGGTPAEAFLVDTGPTLNTAVSLQAGEMHAQVALRTSPTARRVVIDVVKYPITQALA